MLIELKISAENATELHGLILGLAGISKEPVLHVTEERPSVAAVAETPAKPAKAKKEATAPTPEPEPTPEVAEPAVEPAEPVEVTVGYADVQKAITGLAAAKGRDAAVAVLETFGASNGKDLKPEQWAEAIAACQSALED